MRRGGTCRDPCPTSLPTAALPPFRPPTWAKEAVPVLGPLCTARLVVLTVPRVLPRGHGQRKDARGNNNRARQRQVVRVCMFGWGWRCAHGGVGGAGINGQPPQHRSVPVCGVGAVQVAANAQARGATEWSLQTQHTAGPPMPAPAATHAAGFTTRPQAGGQAGRQGGWLAGRQAGWHAGGRANHSQQSPGAVAWERAWPTPPPLA